MELSKFLFCNIFSIKELLKQKLLKIIFFFSIFDDVKRVFVPMLWFENTAELSEDLANEGKLLLVMPSVGQNTGYGLIGIGCLLLVTFSVLTYRKGWRGTDSEQLISQDSF